MEGRSTERDVFFRITATGFLAAIAVFSGILIACTKSNKIEIAKKEPTAEDGFDDGGEPDWIPDYEDTAIMIANIPKETLSRYVNTNATLEYNFQFLTYKKKGDILFIGDNAQIEIDSIPIEQSGTLRIEIIEDGNVKLVGTKDGVTFKRGKNTQSFDFKKVGTDDDDGDLGDESEDAEEDDQKTGTLILTLNITDSQQEEQNDENDQSDDGNIDFSAKILPLAKNYCSDCHAKFGLAVPENRDYFTARKSSLTTRLNKSASNTMPQRGSQEAQRMSDEDRELFIAYIKSL